MKQLSDAPTLGFVPGLTHKRQTRLSILAKDKHPSLLRKSINYGRKKFDNFGTRAQCYKTYSVCDSRIFVLS
jgi:hypothetical protein